MGRVHQWAWLGLVAGCSADPVFICVSDQQCAGGAAPGICQAGWCTFEDSECDSGQRYGEHSGGGLAGTCVPSIGEGTSATTEGPTTTTTSLDAGDPGDETSSEGDMSDESTETTSPDPVELPDPIAWYTFDDPEDPWADVSGNGLHAWCGDPECGEPEPGRLGGAIRLDGLYDHGHVDHDPVLETPDGFTLAAWAWPDGLRQPTTTQAILSKPYDGGTDDSWQLGLAADQSAALAAIHPDSWGDETSAPWPMREGWHHVAATWDGEVLSLYVDGVLGASASVAPLVIGDQYVLIGADAENDGDVQYYGGLLDDVRIYDSALSGEQIAALVAG